MAPLAYSDLGAKYAFFVVLAMFGASEWSIRLRSRMNHGGTRLDRGSIVVVIVTAVLGVAAAFALAAGVQSAASERRVGRSFSSASPSSFSGWHFDGGPSSPWASSLRSRFRCAVVKTVVDTGPYRFVRHLRTPRSSCPSSASGSRWKTAVTRGHHRRTDDGLIIRIRVEERALLNALGEPTESSPRVVLESFPRCGEWVRRSRFRVVAFAMWRSTRVEPARTVSKANALSPDSAHDGKARTIRQGCSRVEHEGVAGQLVANNPRPGVVGRQTTNSQS